MDGRQKIALTLILTLAVSGIAVETSAKKKTNSPSEQPVTTPEPQSSSLDSLFADIVSTQNPDKAASLLAAFEAGEAKAFVKGWRAWQAGDTGVAEKAWRSVSAESGFSPYARLHLAKLLLAEERFAEALVLTPAQPKRTRQIESDLFWLRLEILAELKQGATLRNELKTLTPAERKDRFVQARQEYILGYADFVARDNGPAQRHWTNVLAKYPGYDFDDKILALARSRGWTKETLLPRSLLTVRAENLIQNGLADWGYEIYEELAQGQDDYTEKKALALFRARRYEEAATYFEQLLNGGQSSLDRQTLLVRLSQCYNRTDNFAKAKTLYRQIQTEFPGTSSAKIARFNAAQLALDSGDFAAAAQAFEALLADPKALLPEQTRQARWSRFWAYYLNQNWEKAIATAEAMLTVLPARDETRPALRYFLARAHEQSGNKTAAKAQYQKLTAADDTDYYALLARQRLKFHVLQPVRLVNPVLLASWRSAATTADVWPSSDTVRRYPALGRALVLTEAGLEAYAYDELQSLDKSAASDASLASALPKAGNSRLAFAVGYQAKSGRLPGCDFGCAARLRFPRAYRTYVDPFARHWQIDPALGYAIMRQESAFDPSVVSAAFAYGLMQIIPPTEREIAAKILHEPVSEASLLDPKWNVLFGTYYLKHLSDEFAGELAPTIAAYNAGPYNVSRWQKRRNHGDWDEFVELIPYSETKAYVKKVLVNYWVYSEVYP